MLFMRLNSSCIKSVQKLLNYSHSILKQKTFISHTRNLSTLPNVKRITVEPFGKLLVKCDASITVKSLLSDTNEVVVDSDEDIQFDKLETLNYALVCSMKPNSSTKIELPVNFDLHIECSGEDSITVSNMESKEINIKSNGSVHLNNIKAGTLNVNAALGITSKKLLQGQMNLDVNTGNISADRIQGSDINLTVGSGDINAKAVYSTELDIEAESSNVLLGSVHGHTSIVVNDKGSVSIGSLEGSLYLRQRCGDVSCHVATPGEVDINLAEGNTVLSLDPGVSILLDLVANNIVLDDQLPLDNRTIIESAALKRFIGTVNNAEDNMCQIHTNEGDINLTSLSWIEAITKQNSSLKKN